MDIQKRIREESLLAVPIITNIKGNDVHRKKRADWVDGCNKGIEIMREFMETNKNIDTLDEWDDSHELNNVMNQMVEELDAWEIVSDNELYENILYKTQDTIPIDDGIDNKSRYSVYEMDNHYYKLTWLFNSNQKPLIEYKLKLTLN